MKYLFVLIGLFAIFLVYKHFAKKYNIVDKPKKRSSHNISTIRGGGIIFPLAAIFWFFLNGFEFGFGIGGLFIISVISFSDDLYSLSRKVRIMAHAIGASLLILQLSLFMHPWYLWLIAFIVLIGWLNAFNFMDGINGITALYSLVCLMSFFFIADTVNFISKDLILVIIISILVFAFYNVRVNAVAFAGDVGSVSMAFLLGAMMLSLILETGRFEYMMLFAIYAADSIFTIMLRLIKGENIFKAHRSHLYQIMANEYGMPHVFVSTIYASIQLFINVIAIYMINSGSMTFLRFTFISFIIASTYILIRHNLTRKLPTNLVT